MIDDDPSVRKALLRLFRTARLEASPFSTAEEYLSNAGRSDMECLVIDVRLPGISGLKLHERLRTESSLPALFITGHDDEQARREALAGGAIGFFLKPFDNRQLLETVFRALGVHDF